MKPVDLHVAVRAVGMLAAGLIAVLPGRGDAAAVQTFSRWSTLCTGDDAGAIALGDLDGDGDRDLIFANGLHLPQTDWVYSNDGRGQFYGKRALGNEPDRSYGVALGDLDGDGDHDAVVANDTGDTSPVYHNDGKGNFVLANRLGSGRDERRAVALGDLDQDNDVDVVLVGDGQDHIYINDGKNQWTERAFGPGNDWSLAVVLSDVDRDGDLDIIVANRQRESQHSLVYLNDGRGGMAATRTLGRGGEDTTSVAVGDLDGDRDVDIITVNWRQPYAVHLNDGQGRFPESRPFGSGLDATWTVALGDMDLDGDLDAVVGSRYTASDELGSPSRVYVNDGTGRLASGTAFTTGSNNTRPIALGDVDGDGDLDIVMGNICGTNHVFFNAARAPASR